MTYQSQWIQRIKKKTNLSRQRAKIRVQYHLIGAVSCTRAIAQHAESLRVTTELGLAWVEPSHPSILLSLYIE